jgi:hypothetical protein
MSQQIVYVAVGPRYLAMALRSAAQALAGGFAGGIVIVTDQANPGANAPGSLDLTRVTFTAVATPADPRFGPLDCKTRFLDFTTADQVLFLDCDTLVTGDVTPLFVASGIAMAAEVYPSPAQSGFNLSPDFGITQQAGLATVPFWNTGVVAVGNDAAGKALCAGGGAWHTEWAKFSEWDEMAMLRALKTVGATPVTLPPSDNDQGFPGGKSGLIRHYVGGQKLSPEFQAGLN